MSGIAGYMLKRGRASSSSIAPVLRTLSHRGSDSAGIHYDGPVILGHTRLSIIDLSGGHQPLFAENKQLALVANGEIYNHPEIRKSIESKRIAYKTHSDCESILQLYRDQGHAGIEKLNGMFAFALWDQRKQTLWLGRDRLGIKPLYYCELPDRFIFASEIKALLVMLPKQPEIREQALADYLQNQFITGRESIFKGINRVLPGEWLSVEHNLGIVRHRYWRPEDSRPRSVSFEQAKDEFEPLFTQVLKEHVRSDVPFGLFLSGGVDSAVLLAMLHRFQDEPIRTYSFGYKDTAMAGELDDATKIAEQFNTKHQRITLSAEELFQRLVHTTWACDDLMRDYTGLPLAVLSQIAAKEFKVIFSSEGVDEVFGGYRHYRVNFEDRLKALVRPATYGFRSRGHWRRQYNRLAFGPALAKADPATRTPFRSAFAQARSDWSACTKRQFVDLTTALPDNLLVKADRITMAFGLEARVPMLDHRMVAFGLSLPDELKINDRKGKWFLKRWAENYLPASYLYQPKRGLNVPVRDWFNGDRLNRVEEMLLAHRGIKEWFDLTGIKRMIGLHRSKDNASRELYSLLQFAIWFDLFVEHPGALPDEIMDPLEWLNR